MKRRLFFLIMVLFLGCVDEEPHQPTEPWWWKHRVKVTTLNVIDITATTATIQGIATDDGLFKIYGQKFYVKGNFGTSTEKEVKADTCYASGLFTSKLVELLPHSEYKVQAYASADWGSSTGNQVSFTTLSK
jgi:hypothetical protein